MQREGMEILENLAPTSYGIDNEMAKSVHSAVRRKVSSFAPLGIAE
jgi:hypothetical protein